MGEPKNRQIHYEGQDVDLERIEEMKEVLYGQFKSAVKRYGADAGGDESARAIAFRAQAYAALVEARIKLAP